MPSYVGRKNAEFIFYVGLVSQADVKLLQVNPTIAAGDFKISTDGGAFANITAIPVVTPAGGRAVKFTLSAAEMNGDNIWVQAVDAAGTEWCDNWFNITTTPANANLTQIDGTANASATFNLTKLNIVNSAGSAIVAQSGGGNGSGIACQGQGSGSGISITGGITGNGLSASGGVTSGNGIFGQAQTSGVGIYGLGVGGVGPGILGQGGSGSSGIQGAGTGSGSGIAGLAGITGHGSIFLGGATSGNGISSAAVGSGTGMTLVGSGTVSFLATQGISGPLDSSEKNSIADALLKRDWTAVTGEAGRSVLNALRFLRNKWSFSGLTATITKEDDTTPAWTATVTTDASAEPITSFDGS